jgi:methionyl-tRNA synthetase
MLPKRYTITAALPYANGPLHIGHIAGAYLPADIYVRYLRLKERDVAFICGSDENGAAITIRAKKEGTTPRAIVDRYHAMIQKAFEGFGISFDFYHRTSAPLHHQTSQDFFLTLNEKGEFFEKESVQFFDEEHQQFLADRYIIGTCPKCGYDKAYGDQCERCGSSLSPEELIDPKSTLSGNQPVLRETKHWYLPLDTYEPWLNEWLLEGKKGYWKRNVYGQCKSWLEAGLQARSMTRDLDWGVDVPLPGADGKKLYVWLDAPIGYISATKQWAADHGKDWELYWKTQTPETGDSRLIHFIGKDNIVFHCIIFPAILHAHGGYILPDNVPANEFLNLEGDKISTSRNWAVWLHEYLEDFPGQNDVLRYVLTSILPETKDSEFTWKDFQARNDNELVAILGNFVNRVIVLTHKYFDGVVPEAPGIARNEAAQELFLQLQNFRALVEDNLENFRFRDALSEYINIARAGNKFLTDKEPWKRWKTDKEDVKETIFACLQVIGTLGILSRIFLPETADKLARLLGRDANDWMWDSLRAETLVQSGSRLAEPEHIFSKIPDDVIEEQIRKLEASRQQVSPAVPPQKKETEFDDFQEMDLRIGKVLEAAAVPKADKLLQLKVDTGMDIRTIVSGVAEFFKPEDLVGRQVVVLANLQPRKIRGVVSQGMILFAEDLEGKLHLIGPDGEIDNGSSVA